LRIEFNINNKFDVTCYLLLRKFTWQEKGTRSIEWRKITNTHECKFSKIFLLKKHIFQ